MSRPLAHRYRLQLSVPESACPECHTELFADQFQGGEEECLSCGHRWVTQLEALDPLTDERRRFRFLEREELYRRLAAIARERNNTIGRRYLAEHDPELLFNCVAHHSSYQHARRKLREWLAARPTPQVVVRPRPPQEASPAPDAPPSNDSGAALEISSAARISDTGQVCPYCRDVFEEDEATFACACGAVFHPDCREGLERCSTLGCTGDYQAPPEVQAPTEDLGLLEALHRRLFGDRLRLSFRHPLPVRLFGVCLWLASAAGLLKALDEGLWARAQAVMIGLLLLGVPFLILGIGLTFGCRGATLDRREGWFRTWRGLRVPFLFSLPLWSSKGRQSLSGPREVRLSKEEWYRSAKGGGITLYPVSLEAEVLCAEPSFVRGRRTAERVGTFLGLGVRDRVGGNSGFRPAGTLDRPLVDGLHEPPQVPEQPRTGRVDVSTAAARPVYTVPGRFEPAASISLGLIGGLAGLQFFTGGGPWACALVALVPFALSVALAMRRATRARVWVDEHGLMIQRRIGPFRWVQAIPGDELEELVVGRQKRRTLFHSLGASEEQLLNVLSDRQVLELGAGLGDDELQWLRRSLARDLLQLQRGPEAESP